jgi:hypothetical protein
VQDSWKGRMAWAEEDKFLRERRDVKEPTLGGEQSYSATRDLHSRPAIALSV